MASTDTAISPSSSTSLSPPDRQSHSGLHKDDMDLDTDEAIEAEGEGEVLVTPGSSVSPLGSAPGYCSFGPGMDQAQSPLMRSPSEILHKVLCCSGAQDASTLVNAAMTCKELRSFVYENPDHALWRDIHLQRYDDPRLSGNYTSPQTPKDWKTQVQEREFVCRLFREWDESRSDEVPKHLDVIVRTLLSLYLDLPPVPALKSDTNHEDGIEADGDADIDPSDPEAEPLNASILEPILRSPLFQHIYHYHSLRITRPLLRQLRTQPGNPNRRAQREVVNPDLMRLHVLLPPEFDPHDEVHNITRGYLREMVYSVGNYGESNDWGPFRSDGKVDWGLVDAIGTVMMANAKNVIAVGEDSWRYAVHPMSYGIGPARGWGFKNLQRPKNLAVEDVWDWAGVQGVWCGSYAFLDYTDWIALNEPRLIMLHRPTNQLDLSRYAEAVGDLMQLSLSVYDPQSPAHQHSREEALPDLTTNLPTSNLLPPIHFRGSSQQHQGDGIHTHPAHGATGSGSFVRGVVQVTADDPPQVRWTLVIRYGGEDRWRLEGVQLGGRGSKRGFFGIWTDALKEEHSPCGPIWYWPSE